MFNVNVSRNNLVHYNLLKSWEWRVDTATDPKLTGTVCFVSS